MSLLDRLGPRICVMGPSNSGKSTLAVAIARRRGLPALHLDQLYHQPHTDWQPRPTAEFLRLHALAIEGARWVIEGNYSSCIAPRLARATGLILLDVPTATSLFRYFRRTWCETDRKGALDGQMDSVKWQMLHHIAVVTPRNRARYAAMFEESALPKVRLATRAAIDCFYSAEALER
ncbi:AAA family ATPase [Xylophilus sp. Leaf220]|uniref:AAA family ATPase n=1 Tax=Xylophilus sp. Leaf220 TaxID=1735686 RepID=UPI0006FD6933|nr:AAA family ATPase [Xylophilus sp. Leaf220]KQM69807.1 AAA family ATPase [Xylophilus sp. Leaf220]